MQGKDVYMLGTAFVGGSALLVWLSPYPLVGALVGLGEMIYWAHAGWTWYSDGWHAGDEEAA